jgi:polyisoprenoid-binding protein YceI
MVKQLFALVFLSVFLFSFKGHDDVYVCKNATITFFSAATIEDIKATSNTAVSALNINTGTIYFKVDIKSFQFRESLMQEHFNEDYMESDKYPYAEFKGRILDSVDFSKNGTYPVTVKGDLTIHGVTKNYATQGTLTVAGNTITAHAVFTVKLADHNVQIPRILMDDIATQVQVTVDAEYNPAAVSPS